MGVGAGAPQELEGPKFEGERYKLVKDEMSTLIAPRIQFEVEDAVKGRDSVDIEVRTSITHRVDVVLCPLYLEIP